MATKDEMTTAALIRTKLNILLLDELEKMAADGDAVEADKKAKALMSFARAAKSIDALAPRADVACDNPQDGTDMDDADADALERANAELRARIDRLVVEIERKRADIAERKRLGYGACGGGQPLERSG